MQPCLHRRCRGARSLPVYNGAKLITGETLYIHGGYHIID